MYRTSIRLYITIIVMLLWLIGVQGLIIVQAVKNHQTLKAILEKQ